MRWAIVGRVLDGGKVERLRTVVLMDEGLFRFEANSPPRDPAIPLVYLPTRPGATWKGGKSVFKALGPEKVEVPAGTFNAVAVSGRTSGPGGPPLLLQPLEEQCWYAAGVGLVRRTLGSGTEPDDLIEDQVLVSFTPGKE